VLYGLSCRNYEAAEEAFPGAIGLSPSSVSRQFVEASAAKLRERARRQHVEPFVTDPVAGLTATLDALDPKELFSLSCI